MTVSRSKGLKICAWCQKVLGSASGLSGDTHGICPECEKKLRKQIAEAKKRKGK